MDFTLSAYREYVIRISRSYPTILTFSEYLSLDDAPRSFCLIRHDVDRKPRNALLMAQLEHSLGLRSTYYFRTKPNTLKPDIIRAIAAMGHEIGYHYENLSDTNGDTAAALVDFETNLELLRSIAEVRTICMHGRPFLPWDNRDLWRDAACKSLLKDRFSILGEAYLDIDYTDIAYISDTGRNWTSSCSNVRDRVDSNIEVSFDNREALMNYFTAPTHPKLVFQTHPERWAVSPTEWISQLTIDTCGNLAKGLIQVIRGLSFRAPPQTRPG